MVSIRNLDSDHFWERWIVESICKLDFEDYRNTGGKILKKSLLEQHLDEIIKNIKSLKENIGHPITQGIYIDDLDDIFIPYQILAFLILRTGARLPKHVRETVLRSTTAEFDKRWGWAPTITRIRRIYLEEFRKNIFNHRTGKRQCFRQLHIYDDLDLSNSSIGLEQFYENIQSGKIHFIKYINLDCCDLYEFPEELLGLTHLNVLSMNFNFLEELPENIAQLTSLESLYLMDNKLSSLPISFSRMIWLKKINLIGNPIFESGDYTTYFPERKVQSILTAKEFFKKIF